MTNKEYKHVEYINKLIDKRLSHWTLIPKEKPKPKCKHNLIGREDESENYHCWGCGEIIK